VDSHVVALGVAETSRSKLARDRLQAKITRIVDMISAEQTAKEGLCDNVIVNHSFIGFSYSVCLSVVIVVSQNPAMI